MSQTIYKVLPIFFLCFRRYRGLWLCCFFGLLTGCGIAPERQADRNPTDDIAITEQWATPLGASLAETVPLSPIRNGLLNLFDHAELTELVNEALANNVALMAAFHQAQSADFSARAQAARR